MIELQNITKRFRSLPALDAVSLTINPNQIHGLLGENGAGKSTLMNILFGLLQPDSGAISINGTPARISSPRTAQSLGIGMVHQHFKLVPTLTVLQNLSLALHASEKKIRPRAEKQFAQLHWPINLNARIDTLPVGLQQRVEITKALLAISNSSVSRFGGGGAFRVSRFSPVLILDEPTAVLTPQETSELFTALKSLKQTGVAIIFISHKLAEVQKICDEISILRRGKLVHTGPAPDLTPNQIAEKMVGTHVELPSLEALRHKGTKPQSEPLSALVPQCLSASPVLELRNLFCGMLNSVSRSLHKGQILGIAGVDGNGQSDLVASIIGALPLTAGSIHLQSTDITHAPIRSRIDRIAYIPEDRHRQAVVLPLTLTENLLLKDYRHRPFSTLGFLRFHAWRKKAQKLTADFDIRSGSLSDTLGQLSGGNQQKVVLARELADSKKPLVIAVNPTRGLDIGATAFVMNQLLAARAAGAAILLIHSDLDELLALSDQVSVLYNGQLTPTHWPQTTKDQIGQLMLGLKGSAA